MSKTLSAKMIRFGPNLEPTIYCPGCDMLHMFNVDNPNPHTNAQWTWNGDTVQPTFNPSMNIVGRCHFFLRGGYIQYLNDCKHELAGQTIELPDIPDWAKD